METRKSDKNEKYTKSAMIKMYKIFNKDEAKMKISSSSCYQ